VRNSVDLINSVQVIKPEDEQVYNTNDSVELCYRTHINNYELS